MRIFDKFMDLIPDSIMQFDSSYLLVSVKLQNFENQLRNSVFAGRQKVQDIFSILQLLQ